MQNSKKPLVISAPDPRSIDLIFTDAQRAVLFDRYTLLEVDPEEVDNVDADTLAEARYILGQPPLSLETLRQMSSLKCIFNVESNLLNNMPYDYLFQTGVHVVTTGAVFAEPVAELGLAMACHFAPVRLNSKRLESIQSQPTLPKRNFYDARAMFSIGG